MKHCMKIEVNEEKYLNDFVRLNEQWITKYFELEQADIDLAKDPGKIVRGGGYIFAAVEENEVLGVCALFKEGAGKYQLARMAVNPKYQGSGIGRYLLQSVLDRLEEIGASTVYLISNTKLESAIHLYKKFGFTTVSIGQHPVYSRANIEMERRVS